ncbi:hypothetical protein BO99DRAFT_442173, partial [Aspergillus violaceofuscus CBS 115571]
MGGFLLSLFLSGKITALGGLTFLCFSYVGPGNSCVLLNDDSLYRLVQAWIE